jgi:antitoxin (DNA-binding transcriptional repressor) of toxin-antitoxin stability system
MRTAQVSELKDRLDEVIEAVKNGETVEIWEGDSSFAELVPSLTHRSSRKIQTTTPSDAPRNEDLESFFLENLALIDRLTAFVSRKYSLTASEAEDFASVVKLNLIQDNYAVLRKFEHKSSLATYLTIVIQRQYLNQKIHDWGKWRPSVRARRKGDAAIFLERLVRRDGLGMREALEILRREYPQLEPEALDAVVSSIDVGHAREQLPDAVGEVRNRVPRDSSEIIHSAQPDQKTLKAHLDELVRQGRARRGTGTLPPDFLTRPLPKAKKSVVAALLEDRHSD